MHHHPALQPLLNRQRRLQIRLPSPSVSHHDGVGARFGGKEEELLDAEERGEVLVEKGLLAAGRRAGGHPDLLWGDWNGIKGVGV